MDKLNQLLFKAQSNKKTNWLLSKNLLEKAIKEFPNEKRIYLELAEILNSKDLYPQAIDNYQKALSYDKDDSDILFKIGTCFLNLNEFALALDYYNQIEDDFPELVYNKAFALSRLNKIDRSIEYVKELIDNNPTNDIPYLFLAELYYTKGLFKRSLEILVKAENMFGEKGAIFFIKGSAYSQLENWFQAVNNFSKAYKLNFVYPSFYKNYAMALEKLGDTNKAIEILKKDLENGNKDFQSYFHLIKLYISIREYENAMLYIEKAKEWVNPDDKIYLNLFEKEIAILSKTR